MPGTYPGMDVNGYLEGEPTDEESAARALVIELLRSGRVLAYVGDLLLERAEGQAAPGEPGEVAVMRQMVALAVPALTDQGAARCWQAAGLIELIRELIVDDLRGRLAAEAESN